MTIPIPVPSPKEIKDSVKKLYQKYIGYKQKEKLRIISNARKDPDLYNLLHHIYHKNKFVIHGKNIFPVVTIDLPQNQFDRPESILGKLDKDSIPNIDSNLQKAGQKYVEYLQQLGVPLRNLPTYCLNSIRNESDGTVKLDCSIGKFFDTLRTGDVLEWELLMAVGSWRKNNRNFDTFQKKYLPLRNYVHSLSKSDDLLINPVGRSAAISISTTILFNKGDEYAILIGERSSRGVAVQADLFHVIPGLMFQPVVNEVNLEFSIVHNIYREYLEELFKLPEVNEPPPVISHDYFYENPNLCFLRELIDNGEAKIYITGLVVSLLNLRPEICTLLYIDTSDWYNKHKTGTNNLKRIEFNDEWKSPHEKSKLIPNTVPVDRLEEFGLNPENTVPPGAAAIYLGLKAAKSLRLMR